MLPDFNRLKTFYYVYRYKSIQLAADEMHITRSAVSQQVKNLEQELGISLFIRNNKAIVPTQSAERLVQDIEPFIKKLSDTLNYLERGKNEPHGVLRLGAPVEFGSRKLLEVAIKFRKQYPNVNFQFELAIPPKLLNLLTTNKLDIAFVDNGDVFQDRYPVHMHTMIKEEFILVCSTKYFRRHLNNDSSFKKLKECQYISYVDHGPVLKMWFKHHFRKQISDLNIVLSIENVHGVLTAIRASAGLGVVPSYIVNSEINNGSLRRITNAKSEFINKIMVAQLLDKTPSLTEKTFLDFCLAATK